MIPVLFEIGPIKIYSFGAMLVVAFMVNYALLKMQMVRTGRSPEFAGDIIFWAALGGILGSKVYYLIENYKSVIADPMGMIFSGAGLVFLGGLMGGMLAVTILLRKRGESWLEFADLVAPLLIMGYAIGRIGCFLVGDDYGIPTSLPWGLTFPEGMPITLIPVHPTQIYETILGFVIFAILWSIRDKASPVGTVFYMYLILAGLERFFIEFIRTNNEYVFGLTGAQLISIIMISIGTYFLVKTRQVSIHEPMTDTNP